MTKSSFLKVWWFSTRNNFVSTLTLSHVCRDNWESVVDSVIQATGTVEFEDGLWIVNHLKVGNGLQRVFTIPGVQPGAVHTPGFLWGQTEFQSA